MVNTLKPGDDPPAFSYVRRDGSEGYMVLIDPPDGSPSKPLSARRGELQQLLDQARGDPSAAEFVFIYEQVLRGMEEYLARYGDLTFDQPDHASS